MSTSTSSLSTITLTPEQAKALEQRAVAWAGDSIYDTRCVIQFVQAIFRELAAAGAEATFNADELQGLFRIMADAVDEMESVLGPSKMYDAVKGKKEVAA